MDGQKSYGGSSTGDEDIALINCGKKVSLGNVSNFGARSQIEIFLNEGMRMKTKNEKRSRSKKSRTKRRGE